MCELKYTTVKETKLSRLLKYINYIFITIDEYM